MAKRLELDKRNVGKREKALVSVYLFGSHLHPTLPQSTSPAHATNGSCMDTALSLWPGCVAGTWSKLGWRAARTLCPAGGPHGVPAGTWVCRGQGQVEGPWNVSTTKTWSHSQQAELPRRREPGTTAPTFCLSFCITGYWVRQVSPTTMGCPSSVPEGAPHLPGLLEASLALTGTRKMLSAGPRS